jgi:hypothetical protein
MLENVIKILKILILTAIAVPVALYAFGIVLMIFDNKPSVPSLGLKNKATVQFSPIIADPIKIDIVKDWNFTISSDGHMQIQGVANDSVRQNKFINAVVYSADGAYVGNGIGIISSGGGFSMSLFNVDPGLKKIKAEFSSNH